MISKKSAEIINSLNLPMLIYEYQKEHSWISIEISPVFYGDNWLIKIRIAYEDPYDGYQLKSIGIAEEIDPFMDELFIEDKVRSYIKELLDTTNKIQNKEEK